MKVTGFQLKFALQRFADFTQAFRRRTNAQVERFTQMRHERRLADACRAKNENVLALHVQPLKLRGFLSPTNKRKREPVKFV